MRFCLKVFPVNKLSLFLLRLLSVFVHFLLLLIKYEAEAYVAHSFEG